MLMRSVLSGLCCLLAFGVASMRGAAADPCATLTCALRSQLDTEAVVPPQAVADLVPPSVVQHDRGGGNARANAVNADWLVGAITDGRWRRRDGAWPAPTLRGLCLEPAERSFAPEAGLAYTVEIGPRFAPLSIEELSGLTPVLTPALVDVMKRHLTGITVTLEEVGTITPPPNLIVGRSERLAAACRGIAPADRRIVTGVTIGRVSLEIRLSRTLGVALPRPAPDAVWAVTQSAHAVTIASRVPVVLGLNTVAASRLIGP
jgi:hypothetical protein